jgi:hypothetical protein
MKTIGRIDKIDLPEFGLSDIPAKIDTGANRSAIHCSQIFETHENGRPEISFHIPLDSSHGEKDFHVKSFFKKKIRSSSGHMEERYIIKTTVVLFGKKIHATFSLTDRAEMKYPILLGRKLLNSKFIVDVAQQDLSFKEKTSLK